MKLTCYFVGKMVDFTPAFGHGLAQVDVLGELRDGHVHYILDVTSILVTSSEQNDVTTQPYVIFFCDTIWDIYVYIYRP